MTPTSDNSKPLPGSTLLETSQKNLPPIPVTIAWSCTRRLPQKPRWTRESSSAVKSSRSLGLTTCVNPFWVRTVVRNRAGGVVPPEAQRRSAVSSSFQRRPRRTAGQVPLSDGSFQCSVVKV
jgi:hypothetical protein